MDLFFLQPYNAKRRFQQYCLSYIIGIVIDSSAIPIDDNRGQIIREIRSFLEFVERSLNDMAQSSQFIPTPTLHAKASLEGLLRWSADAITIRFLERGDSRLKIIESYEEEFAYSRNLWKALNRTPDMEKIRYLIDKSKRGFLDKISSRRQPGSIILDPVNDGAIDSNDLLNEFEALRGQNLNCENSDSPPGFNSD